MAGIAWWRPKHREHVAGTHGVCRDTEADSGQEVGLGYTFRANTDSPLPARIYLPQTAPPTGDQMFRHMSLWGTSLIQTGGS